MKKARSISRSVLVFLVSLLLLPTLTFAKVTQPEPIGHLSASGSSVQWTTTADHESIVLTIVAPDGTLYQRDFVSGHAPSFHLQEIVGKISDGSYAYEMRLIPRISSEVRRQLAAARVADNDDAIARIQQASGISEEIVQSGNLLVVNGSFVNSDADEPAASVLRLPTASASTPSTGTSSASLSGPRTIKPLDIVQADDVIIQGSLCVGLDCVNNESFGFDTIRLKENNTRIAFVDTSTSAGFPTTDWQLTANDSASGGANKFSIEDITDAKVPFTVIGLAPTNSIFVASNGKVGFRTGTPALDLHITTSDTPAIRQEQTSAGGFTAQTWDIGANEANWFVRDVTGGSRLPLRIRPGAPTSSVDIAASGNVGIGTASPGVRLQVINTSGATEVARFFTSDFSSGVAGSGINIQTGAASGNSYTEIGALHSGGGVFDNLILQRGGGNVGIGTTAPTSRLQVVGLPAFANNAAASAGGLTVGAFYRTGGDPDLVCVVH
jgi:hypothetical protein